MSEAIRMTTPFDHSAEFDRSIRPHVDAIFEKCKDLDIPCLVAVCYSNEPYEDGTGTQNGMQVAVIFCEDIDRVMAGERSVAMDDILNIIDGIDTKSANIVVVLTTNDLQAINPAMLRPGRLDAVIEVTPPDAKAVEKLLRVYGGEAIAATTDLAEAGKALDGAIPAVISEVVKRAKLAQLRLQQPGEKVAQLSEAALLEAAKTMRSQLKLLKDRSEANFEKPALDQALSTLVSDAVKGATDRIASKVAEIADNI